MSTHFDLFISHANVDAIIAKPFVNLIESGVGISPKKIFFTSNKGQGIKPGKDFKSSIHNGLDNSTIVIALISENYYNSPFCMCELGGSWLQAKDLIPLLVPPIKFKDMKAVLEGMQALRLNIAEDLDEMRDELSERLDIDLLPTPRWNEKRDEFLRVLSKNINKLPLAPIVQRTKLEEANKIISEYQSEVDELSKEREALIKQNQRLRNAKNKEEVSAIIIEDLEDIEIFEKLTSDIKKALKNLDSASTEAIYTNSRGEDYYPGRASSNYSWDDFKTPIEYKEVILTSEENGVTPNSNHPKVAKVIQLLNKLEDWLEGGASSQFFEWYISDNDGYEPDLSDKRFWDEHLW